MLKTELAIRELKAVGVKVLRPKDKPTMIEVSTGASGKVEITGRTYVIRECPALAGILTGYANRELGIEWRNARKEGASVQASVDAGSLEEVEI